MRVLFVLAMVLGLGACRAYPTRPADRSPGISSVVAFPTVIGQGDSTLVTVFATDPDGDSLYYDWVTDSRLIIKDDPLGYGYLYSTRSSSHVFYRSSLPAVSDTVWIGCYVRDGKGGMAGRAVRLLLRD